ncbi:RNA 2'-phosphotransferase [Thermoflavimicrobium daqui]|uniref:Probable RNA 2'-phosphotransferase n=1 Tax=Thermoflavimicrobium daqui TaxID=2137476 RepID=A0A364K4S0_9BACL|nr:RNA 2'-phosphotransferase [Thermoflavimicrobium daqui]RAL24259.1 RNA--NAD 2'-phosphotransferase [Thermoflavimicrobium daqui]
MNGKRYKKISKFLSLILRHHPEQIQIQLDPSGWVEIDTLLAASKAHGTKIQVEELLDIVRQNDKQRFSISPDGKKIRANYGHSVQVQLGYHKKVPPLFLLHGTATRFLPSILIEGLTKQNRQFVHLTTSQEMALQVGSRYGKAIILKIEAEQMAKDGYPFFLSDNGEVWLTDHVPVRYIQILEK